MLKYLIQCLLKQGKQAHNFGVTADQDGILFSDGY